MPSYDGVLGADCITSEFRLGLCVRTCLDCVVDAIDNMSHFQMSKFPIFFLCLGYM